MIRPVDEYSIPNLKRKEREQLPVIVSNSFDVNIDQISDSLLPEYLTT